MKKVFFGFLGFAAMVCLICGTVFADYNNVTIYVNDKVVQSSQPGVVINDTTFVPVRVVSESLGCNVKWNEAEQCVTIIKENSILNMTIGSVNVTDGTDAVYQLPEAPFVLNDSVTMVPVRFVSEKLGMSVKWDETSTTVFINSDLSYKNITNLPVYYKASFEDKLTNIINYNFNGDFYQAQAIIGLVTDSEIESARIINPIGLAEFYVQKETTERNIQLMANGLPNEIEQQLADTRAYLDNAINLYNQGLYYEAADALSDFYLYRTTPVLVDEYNQLVSDIQVQINYLPYRTLNDIRKMVENGDYYGAYARVNAFLEQGNLSDDVRNTAEILKGEIEDEIAAYERSLEVVGYRYVTNVANAVNFRQKPNTSSTIITTIPYGTRVGYVEDANSEYARVKYDNMYGYVAKFYLSNYSPPKQYSAIRYVWRSGAVEMLDQPKSGAGVILTLAAETPVGLIEIVSDTYARVDYDGNQGYIRRDQLVLSIQ